MKHTAKKGSSRRAFLAGCAGAAVSFPSVCTLASNTGSVVSPPPQVILGRTGIRTSYVAQGTGMRGYNRTSNHTRMGFEKFVALIRHDFDRGVTFFDMADLYGTHIYFREALRFIPREKVTILTKLWWRYDGPPAQTPPAFQKKSARIALQRFRHELTTDYLDIVLLHCMTTPDWPQELAAYMEVLSEEKDRKRIRAVGVSCHDIEALRVAAENPWVDVLLARINPRGAKMDGPVDEVRRILLRARRNGKTVIGMKIYGEGTLASRKEECIRFIQSSGLVDAITVGAETPEQMDETLRLVARYPAAKRASK